MFLVLSQGPFSTHRTRFVINLSSNYFGNPVTEAVAVDELAQRRLEMLVEELIIHLRERQGVTHGIDYVGDGDQLARRESERAGPVPI